MKRIASLVVAVVIVAAAAACPDPAEVGHVPKQQLDDTRARVHNAEVKAQQATDAAAAQLKDVQ